MLWEGFGFGWAETAYSGVTFPLVEPVLEKAARLGFRRIVVFPYFLFTGILVDRIYEAADAVAARHPDIEFVKAPYLNDHPLVIDTFVERAEEILAGQNLMNCAMCKYREQVLGFEDEVGLPQESHHHHVEGVGGGGPALHDHDHSRNGPGHRHDLIHPHGHHHPYPHADHPLGPLSLKRG
jgi:sirohydrochlorin cobaltochelatase